MKKMKKILSIILALAMVLTMVACASKEAPKEEAPADKQEETKEETPKEETKEEAPKEEKLDWPKKTITIICPYSAGGGSDLMSRAVGEELAERLGVSVVVEDNPGGSGSVGMQLLAAAKNDGYTLILTACGACTLSPWLNDVTYTDESFAPICQISASPSFICVRKDSGITTFDELLEKAKANPDTITVGTSGAGSSHHIGLAALGLGLADNANLFKHIAYGGGAEAVTNLLGGHVDATATIWSEVAAYIESGDFVPLLCNGSETPDFAGDIPCAADYNVSSDGGTWYAFAAPAGTDQAIIDLLEAEILDIMSTEKMQETFENLGNPVVPLAEEDIAAKWSEGYKNAEVTLKAIGML